MAEVIVGNTSITLNRCNESTWDIGTSKPGDSLGPHIIIQKGTQILYVYPNEREVKDLKSWCEKYLK